MEKNILNFSKKLGLLENLTALKNETYPFRTTFIYLGQIIPDTVIKERAAFKITHLDRSLYLQGFAITTYTKQDRIYCINLFGEHPNCDPNTNAYCLPEQKKNLELSEDVLLMLIKNFKTYYLDNCYFIPQQKDLEYKKLQSINIQFNKEN